MSKISKSMTEIYPVGPCSQSISTQKEVSIESLEKGSTFSASRQQSENSKRLYDLSNAHKSIRKIWVRQVEIVRRVVIWNNYTIGFVCSKISLRYPIEWVYIGALLPPPYLSGLNRLQLAPQHRKNLSKRVAYGDSWTRYWKKMLR